MILIHITDFRHKVNYGSEDVTKQRFSYESGGALHVGWADYLYYKSAHPNLQQPFYEYSICDLVGTYAFEHIYWHQVVNTYSTVYRGDTGHEDTKICSQKCYLF